MGKKKLEQKSLYKSSSVENHEQKERNKKEFSEEIIQESRTLERVIDIEYEFLPSNHPVSIYLNERIRDLFPNETLTIKITNCETAPNALSLATGTIIVTRGLLETLKTQDEVDVILAHEAIHYTRRHVAVIEETVHDLVERIQHPAKETLAQGVRLLGQKRFSEWEADLRSLLEATKGKINPAAARSAMLRLEEYAKEQTGVQNKRDIEHDGLIDRVVNIGALSQLIDFESTSQQQQPFPKEVEKYVRTKHRPGLYERFIAASTDTMPEIARELPVGNLLFVLRHLQADTSRQDIKKKFSTEAILKIVQQKLQQAFPHQKESAEFVMHQLLECVVGVQTEEAEGTAYEAYMQSIDPLETEKALRGKLRLLDKKTTERLGIVIPQFEDVVHFIGTTLSGANANELFNNKQGTLDVKKYARFCKDITNHFRDIASGNGFRPITPAMVTQCAIQEALLNVDLRKTHQPFLDLLGELKKAGIPIYREAVAKALDSTLQLDIKTSEYENHLTVAEGENMHVSRIIHETLEYALEHCWEEEMFHPNADELERFVDQALSACTSVEELHSVFVTMNTFVERRIFTVKGKNNTFHQRAEAENGVFTLHKFASLLSEKVLTFQAEWLPSSVTERFALVLACMRSGITFLANEQTVSNLQDFSRTLLSTNLATSKELAEAFLQYGAILNGTHPLYEQYGWKPKSFRPSRLLPYTEEHLDIATITSDTLCKEEITDGYVLWKYIQEYYDLLMDCLERGSMNIEEVVQQFDTLVSSLSSSIDKLPATIARDIYGLGSILTPFFLQQEFNADDFTDQKRALYCSQLFSDTHSAQLLQQVVMERLLQHKSFDERLYWLFTNPITRFSMTKRARTDFVEHEVQTPEQFAAVRKELKRYIDMATDSEYVGAAVILEQAFGKDAQPRELFSMLFDMHRFDVKIKKYIFEKVQQAQNYEDAAENERAIVATDRALMGLAQANDFVRYGVVRELLIGKDGLLHTQRDREWLLDYLFRATAQKGKQTAEQQQTQQVVQELVRAMAQTAPEDMLFFALAPLIHERIMRAPQQTTSWEHILKKYANYTDTTAVEDTLRDAEKIRQQSTTWKQLIQQTYQPHTPSPTPAGVRVNEIQLCRDRVQFIAEQYPLPKESDKQKTEAFTIERFVVKLAESLGSPGVRFLQILGQYIDVPPTLQSAFNDATDSVAGQNKMTAYETIQREWPECEHQILRVLDRIGGGSLFSVYLCEMHDRTQEVVKVLAPNAKMKAKITIDLLRESLTKLVQQQPERYTIALAIIDEIEEWIMQDIDYDRFIERDAEFRRKHHNFTEEGFEYSLYIPQSKPLHEDSKDNVYVKREEFINGKTLTRLTEADGFDKKQIAALLVKNYFQQIMDGQVHADVHPGNFMVFRDTAGKNRVAVIDRNNYIELNKADKELLFTLQMRAMAGQGGALVPALRNYIEREQGTVISDEQATRIQEQIEQRIQQGKTIQDIAKAITIAFHQEKIRIPLKITLLIKNFNGLDRIARDAGFNSLQEAFGYNPTQQ